jgi:hypothetical protein
MSLEAWSILASFGTFVVIAATAIAALIQLRHLRASNQIAAITTLQNVTQSREFQRARRFVRQELGARLTDPLFRAELCTVPVGDAAHELLFLGNYYEELGMFVKRKIIDSTIACDFWSAMVIGDWKGMAPAIAIVRRAQGPSTWENFEYMKDIGLEWIARHPHGVYPANRRREPLEDVWLAADTARDQGAQRERA